MSTSSPKIIGVSSNNYLSGFSIKKLRSTKRGRVGLDIGSYYPPKDKIDNFAVVSPKDDAILLFTSVGKVYKFNLDDDRAIIISEDLLWPDNPANIPSLLETNTSSFDPDEKIVQILPVRNSEFEEELFCFMTTEQGMLKKLALSQLENVTRAGKKVITLFEGDDLSHVIKIRSDDEILLGLSTGYAVRFSAESVRPSGRNSLGVKSISIDSKSGDKIISLSSTSNPDEAFVVCVDEEGKGKCTSLQEFRLTSRRSRGTVAYKLGFSANATKTKKGAKSYKLKLIVCAIVHDHEELVLLSNKNRINRIGVGQVTVRRGRNTAGTILVRLGESGERLFKCVKFDFSTD